MSKEQEKKLYQNNWEHITDELTKLDLLIQLAVLKTRYTIPESSNHAFKGVFISDEEIDSLLQSSPQENDKNEKVKGQLNQLNDKLIKLQDAIDQKQRNSLENGIYLALPRLSQLFGLAPFEEQSVLICLAPELDRRYEKLYGYLQDDMTRRKPSAELIFKLLCANSEDMIPARTYFLHQALLIKNKILHLVEDPRYPKTPLLAKFINLDNRIVNFLLGIVDLDENIQPFSSIIMPVERDQNGCFEECKAKFINLTKAHLGATREQSDKLIYYCYGPYGAGRQEFAEFICRDLGVPLIVCDIENILAAESPFEETIHLIFREALLQPAAIYLKQFQRILDEEEKNRSYIKIIARNIDEFSWLTFLAGEKNWEAGGAFNQHSFYKVEFAVPDFAARKEIWQEQVNGKYHFANDVDFADVANGFRFTFGQINDALVAAHNLARLRDAKKPEITMPDLYLGCRAQCNQKLGTLAQKITPNYAWRDIVLPDEILAQLHAICDHVKYRHKVYEDWGFDKKLSLGKGLSALFSGPSGTGKTMAAEIIANELQLNLYKIDLSSVVSKYVGETEKNLSKIFHEAETSNAILFFDEADALFGKRSEVKDAHDRYANIEIGYLLQKMEEYEGISILATNLKKNMDEAFFRRLNFLVEFPFPDATHRLLIWKSIFPDEIPLGKDIDFDFLAARLKISGGNIKNIAVNSAFLAAGNSEILDMDHIIKATTQEYQKSSMPLNKADFSK